MKSLPKIFALALVVSLGAACGDDGNNQTGDAPPGGDPPAPALGQQQDRIGRPAVSSALVGAFNFLPGGDDKNAAKEAYNTDDNVAGWIEAHKATIKAHLAIYDSADAATAVGGGCVGGADDNSVFNNAEFMGITGPYEVLATALADDRLYVNSDGNACADLYLGVEADALGLIPNNDCGGRTPTADVIDTSYTVLVTGNLGAPVSDGVAEDADGRPDNDTFPFLSAP